MPQLINKTKPDNYVKTDRSLLRDKRLKPTPKLIYSLLHNLAKSCEKVFPTHFWIAIEIGVETEPTPEEIATHGLEKARANKDRAVRKYIRENLEPLLHLGLIKAVETPGKGYDYEIYDYDPEPWGSPPLNLQVQGTLNPGVHPLIYGEKEIEKEKVGENSPQNFLEKNPKPENDTPRLELDPQEQSKSIGEKFQEYFDAVGIDPESIRAHEIVQEVSKTVLKKDLTGYVDYLLNVKAKLPGLKTERTSFGNLKKLELPTYTKWFYADYKSWLQSKDPPPAAVTPHLPYNGPDMSPMQPISDEEKAKRHRKMMEGMQAGLQGNPQLLAKIQNQLQPV
jgi:hypothetical protein